MEIEEASGRVRPFAAVLQEMAGGSFHVRLSEQLRDLTAAVADTGRKGTLTVQIEVKPVKPGQVEVPLEVTAKSVLKAPEPPMAAPTSIFFSDGAGNLTRNDPRQLALPLRDAAGLKVSNG